MEMKNAGVIRYSCRIQGQTGSVYQTWVEEEDGQLTTGFCTCPAYQRTECVCKHIIALSLEVWNEFNAAQKNHGGLDILSAIREQEKETAQLRCKALEEERRRRDELFIDELLRGSEVLHAQELGEEKQDIRLLPVLTPKMGGVDMELKVGARQNVCRPQPVGFYPTHPEGRIFFLWKRAGVHPSSSGV